jgi:hypothetical protein
MPSDPYLGRRQAVEAFTLTVGFDDAGRHIAIISSGAHPELGDIDGATILTVALVDELPNRDPKAWFLAMVEARPWESRQ